MKKGGKVSRYSRLKHGKCLTLIVHGMNGLQQSIHTMHYQEVFEAIIKPYTNFAGIAVKIKELAKAYNVFAIT